MEKHFVVVQQTPEIPLNTNYSHQERTFAKIEYENSDNLPPKTHIRAIVGNDKSKKWSYLSHLGLGYYQQKDRLIRYGHQATQ